MNEPISVSFELSYAEAVRYGLSALGMQISNVVSDYLSKKYNVTLKDTYKNPKLLTEALEKSLAYGAVIVETRIIRYLSSQLSAPLDNQPSIRIGHPEDFERYIYELVANPQISKIQH